mmetsp:Transcript_22672/g.44889  ORF Transcript_22672/g.44889 Transcript_22672/m.44889 type:complete len:228 (+) Transcript_22672:63-746(+)|eukprot:CAMPEP_0175138578 /NCGR_PEP_ID=MMETSP0087-20121206/10429_1 /TAXON_ID=136419 /ORGANISM="Unknown Unknown, Strain D1" /LENGTH=227 /DNA_ID=CAMNT_0016421501 /DNA_START=63 /DNA_END=746 /DNA_ORIENTATION=+
MADAKVITELSLAGKQFDSLPARVQQRCGQTLLKLDLTECEMKEFDGLKDFPKLEQLILDKNNLESLATIPVLKTVHTLWLNNNRFFDLATSLDQIERCFPNLTYLSMLMNPCVPNVYLDDGAERAYKRYRLFVIYRLKRLQFLDSTEVTEMEKKEAERTGKDMAPARPKGQAAGPQQIEKSSAPRAPKPKQSNSPPRVATFLAKGGKPRYDGSNSEGNRFIMNDDL